MTKASTGANQWHKAEKQDETDQSGDTLGDHDGPSGMAPLCGETEFTELLEGMVADFAPRVFAIIQELGDRVDARIAAWGIAFEDRVEVLGVDSGLRMSLRSPERALPGFAWDSHITPRVDRSESSEYRIPQRKLTDRQ